MNNLVHAAAAVFQMKAGKRVLIAAHGNSLRGIVKHLDGISDEDIMGLNLPTGIPFVYELDENFKPVVSMKVRRDRLLCEYEIFWTWGQLHRKDRNLHVKLCA